MQCQLPLIMIRSLIREKRKHEIKIKTNKNENNKGSSKGLATKKSTFSKLLEKSLFFDKFVAIFCKKYGSFSPKI